MYVRPDSIPRG